VEQPPSCNEHQIEQNELGCDQFFRGPKSFYDWIWVWLSLWASKLIFYHAHQFLVIYTCNSLKIQEGIKNRTLLPENLTRKNKKRSSLRCLLISTERSCDKFLKIEEIGLIVYACKIGWLLDNPSIMSSILAAIITNNHSYHIRLRISLKKNHGLLVYRVNLRVLTQYIVLFFQKQNILNINLTKK